MIGDLPSMRGNYRVAPLDQLEIWQIAKAQRRRLARRGADRIDPICLEDTSEIWTTLGTKDFRLEIVSEGLPGDVGQTTYDGAEITVKVSRRLRHQALLGVGAARFAVARELGHATLHLEALLDMGVGSRPPSEIFGVPALGAMGARSSILQAKKFATAFLIDDPTLAKLGCSEEISIQLGVSLSHLHLYYSQMAWAISRADLSPRLRAFANEFRQSTGF